MSSKIVAERASISMPRGVRRISLRRWSASSPSRLA
jgi:hypothetical protein